MNIEKIKTYNCPVEAAMDVIGGKYKALIVYELIGGIRRYSEIQKAVPQATPRMLSKQLKELEEDGVINRTLYPVVPPKTEYSLTELGETLVPIVVSLCKWGEYYFNIAGIPVPCDEDNT
ncbi:MAG: helix-turn-helix transcriptional regulator [Acidaminococcaceae bacterium]|nr:helix-turn-helix transcriptional regulator [Acidaminococcaceae bacterium]MBQ9696923.1 helix-turn-helix transcriptional regulator [Acidaminococcaceae bacterium]